MRKRENERNWTWTQVIIHLRLMVWRRKANSDGTEEQITQKISYSLSSCGLSFPMVNHYMRHVLLKSKRQTPCGGLFMYVPVSAQLIEVKPLVLSELRLDFFPHCLTVFWHISGIMIRGTVLGSGPVTIICRGALNNEISKLAISTLQLSSCLHFSACSQPIGVCTAEEVQMSRYHLCHISVTALSRQAMSCSPGKNCGFAGGGVPSSGRKGASPRL